MKFINIPDNAKYIMKNNVVYRNSRYTIINYCLYSDDFSYLGSRDMTPNQAKKVSKNKLTVVSPIRVFGETKGTMGFRNLTEDKLKQFQDVFSRKGI